MDEYMVTGKRKMRPVHPGSILREDVLPDLGISVSEAARRLRISRQTLHRILSEKSSITPAMALRLGKFCGNGPDVWLRLQQAFDLWNEGQDLASELEKIPAPSGG